MRARNGEWLAHVWQLLPDPDDSVISKGENPSSAHQSFDPILFASLSSALRLMAVNITVNNNNNMCTPLAAPVEGYRPFSQLPLSRFLKSPRGYQSQSES